MINNLCCRKDLCVCSWESSRCGLYGKRFKKKRKIKKIKIKEPVRTKDGVYYVPHDLEDK